MSVANCIVGACPALFESNRRTYVVVGKRISSKEAKSALTGKVGKGEVAVEIPARLLGK